MKKLLRMPVKAAFVTAWFAIIPLSFAFGFAPFLFFIVFICWLFDDNSEPFWKLYKMAVSEFWDTLHYRNVTGSDAKENKDHDCAVVVKATTERKDYEMQEENCKYAGIALGLLGLKIAKKEKL